MSLITRLFSSNSDNELEPGEDALPDGAVTAAHGDTTGEELTRDDLPTGAVPPGADAAPAGGDTAMAQGVSEVATDAPGTADEAEPTTPEA